MNQPRRNLRHRKTLAKQVASFTAYFIPAPEGGYVVEVPSLPGCLTQGETFEEAEENIQDAIQAYVASLVAHGDPVPTQDAVVFRQITVRVPRSV